MNQISGDRPISRRAVRTERMVQRVRSHAMRVALDCHQRHLLEWARAGEGPYPEPADSHTEAIEELTILIGALGSLSELEPGRFDADAGLIVRERK